MNVPFYVYLLFFILIYIGIKRSYSRIIKVQRLFITSFIFIILSLRGMISIFNVLPIDIFLWLTGILSGMMLGFLHVYSREIEADHVHGLIKLPGDYSMFFLILAIFGFEFFVHYSIDARLPVASTVYFKWASIFVLGAIAGMSIGRSLNYFLKYQKSPSGLLI